MKDAMGLILTDGADARQNELTELRSLAALPFAGRYRLIDFILSSMVNSGISNVGVATQQNYSSLMDHLGSGKPWDLNRKEYGLFILPPFLSPDAVGANNNDIDTIHGVMTYLRRSRQKYVVLANGHLVCNLVFEKAFAQHIATDADITVLYNKERDVSISNLSRFIILETDETGRITGIEKRPAEPKTNKASMEIMILERTLLISLVEGCVSRGEHSFVFDILIKNLNYLKIYGHEFEGFVGRIDSVTSYFEINMLTLRDEVRRELFGAQNLIYTKVKDKVPTRFMLNSNVSDCLIADGCTIDGTIENSIIFRGVHIGTGSVVRNCIIMQNSHISNSCDLEHVLVDKECLIRDGKRLIGQNNYPVIIRKRGVV